MGGKKRRAKSVCNPSYIEIYTAQCSYLPFMLLVKKYSCASKMSVFLSASVQSFSP